LTHELDGDYLKPVWDLLQDLKLVCDQETAELAAVAMNTLRQYVYGIDTWPPPSEEIASGIFVAVHLARDRYLAAVRREFGLKKIKLLIDV
jgi:hypothetical protein